MAFIEMDFASGGGGGISETTTGTGRTSSTINTWSSDISLPFKPTCLSVFAIVPSVGAITYVYANGELHTYGEVTGYTTTDDTARLNLQVSDNSFKVIQNVSNSFSNVTLHWVASH